MVNTLATRLFEYKCIDHIITNNKSAFATGSHWTSFSRLVGPPQLHLKYALEKVFGFEATWHDTVKALYRAVWCGEHDVELRRLSNLLSGNLDTQPLQIQRKLCELFTPILTLMQLRETEASRLQTAAQKQAEQDTAAAEQQKESMQSDQTSVRPVEGDVTDDMFADKDAMGKRSLCEALNKDAKQKQAAALDSQLCKAAAEILRSRMVVVESCAAAKSYMESSTKDGLRTRIAFTDWTQFQSLQSTGVWTKLLSTKPSQEFQKTVASNVQMLPFVSINGCVLIRAGQQPVDHFNAELSDAFPFPRPIFVPIDMPKYYERAVKSAARRALGPAADAQERSGVVFTMRCIGARSTTVEEDAAQDVEDSEGDVEPAAGKAEGDPDDGDVPMEALNTAQLRKKFGRSALDAVGAKFQHESKIGETGRFMSRLGSTTRRQSTVVVVPLRVIDHACYFCWAITRLSTTMGARLTTCCRPAIRADSVTYITESGHTRTCRRSQVHPTVVFSALKSTLATSAMGLTANDSFVQIAGGTPEPMVAACMLGFQHVFYIASNEKEVQRMTLPSTAVELSSCVDYMNYTSPDPDSPEKGTLAVEAIKMLVPYIRNFLLEVPDSIMVPPPFEIVVPPLQTFTFVQVTGRVIARTISATGNDQPSQSLPSVPSSPPAKKAKTAAKSGPGSSTGEEPPAIKTKGKIVVAGDEAEFDEAELDDEEGGSEEDDEAALARLQEAASAKKPKGRPVGGGKPAKKRAKPN